MGWTKVDRESFLKTCDTIRGIMPQEVISKQGDLFADVLEVDSTTPNPRYQKIKLVLKYPPLAENPDGDPMPKQSARFKVSRYFNGPKKGELIIYKNDRTGKDDVIIKSYPEAKVVHTTEILRTQIVVQLKAQHFVKFRGPIFVTRMEFIFKVSKNAPNYMMNDLKAGTKIYFKDTKPDLDNLEKIVWDSMQTVKGDEKENKSTIDLVYDNDSQIVSKNGVFKRYGIVPGCIVEMEGYI